MVSHVVLTNPYRAGTMSVPCTIKETVLREVEVTCPRTLSVNNWMSVLLSPGRRN